MGLKDIVKYLLVSQVQMRLSQLEILKDERFSFYEKVGAFFCDESRRPFY